MQTIGGRAECTDVPLLDAGDLGGGFVVILPLLPLTLLTSTLGGSVGG